MHNGRLQTFETLVPLVFVLLLLQIFYASIWFCYAALLLVVILLFCKPLATLLARSWRWFAATVAAVNTKILLTMIFYLLLTPLALLFRIFNKNPLRLKAARELPTYYGVREHQYSAADLDKTW